MMTLARIEKTRPVPKIGDFVLICDTEGYPTLDTGDPAGRERLSRQYAILK